MEAYIRKVRYYECDAMGVTHHSNYIRFMEEARIDCLDRMGYGFAALTDEGVVSPVVSLACRYLKPSRFDDVLEIAVSVADISKFKLTLSYTMTLRGEVIFTGESVHCFLKDGCPVDIAERFPLLTINKD